MKQYVCSICGYIYDEAAGGKWELSADEFYTWSKAAREVNAACEAGEITQDKFKVWLELM